MTVLVLRKDATPADPKVIHRLRWTEGEWVPACGCHKVAVKRADPPSIDEFERVDDMDKIPEPSRLCEHPACFGGGL